MIGYQLGPLVLSSQLIYKLVHGGAPKTNKLLALIVDQSQIHLMGSITILTELSIKLLTIIFYNGFHLTFDNECQLSILHFLLINAFEGSRLGNGKIFR